MKTILHISETFHGGGAEAVFRDTLEVSNKLGFVSDYFVSKGKISPFSYVYSFRSYFELRNKLLKLNPEVIHIHNFYHFLTPSILQAIKSYKKNNKCKVVFTAHDYHLICPNSALQFFENKKRKNFSCLKNNVVFTKKFDHRTWFHSTLKLLQFFLGYRVLKLNEVIDIIISPSNFLRDTFLNYGVTQEIKVIRNPAFLSRIKKAKSKVDKKHIDIVFFGRLSSEKGLLEFIDLLEQHSKLKINFHIYGHGEIENKLISKSTVLRDGLNIILHGFVENKKILEVISEYDIFVLPSLWYENAPLSIIEAAIAGLPVMVPNVGGLIEMASLSKYYFTINSTGIDIDGVILEAFKYAGDNSIVDESIFLHEKYMKEICNIYTKNFI
ncbi:TPA: glycosyltransferase [Raoultella planticola]